MGARASERCAGTDRSNPQDLFLGRPVSRISPQQSAAEGAQILRDITDQVSRGHRLGPLLLSENVQELSRKGARAGQGLVQHHADAVPVACRRHGQPGRLLGGHVRRCAGEMDAVMKPFGAHVGHEAEVQQNNAAVLHHEDVRGLDVAVELPGRVQHVKAFGKLQKSRPQASQLESSRGLAGFAPLASDRCAATGGLPCSRFQPGSASALSSVNRTAGNLRPRCAFPARDRGSSLPRSAPS